jgi:hypothetical protein
VGFDVFGKFDQLDVALDTPTPARPRQSWRCPRDQRPEKTERLSPARADTTFAQRRSPRHTAFDPPAAAEEVFSMSLRKIGPYLFAGAFVFSANIASAQSQCSEACADPTVDCATSCWTCDILYYEPWCPGTITYTTCGEAGMSCGQCAPNWVEVSREKIGGAVTEDYNFLGIKFCRWTEWFIVTDQDLNACDPNNLYRERCDDDEHVGGFHTHGDCFCHTDPEDLDRTEYCGGSSC